MIDRKQDQIDGLTLRQFILDETPDNAVTRIQTADQTTQTLLFSAVFGAFTHGIKEMGLKFIFPVGTVLSIVPESINLYRFIFKTNHKSANSILGTVINVGTLVIETVAVTIMVAALFAAVTWVAPLLFLINVGAKFLYSLFSSLYYLGKTGLNWYRGETDTQQHQADKNNLIQSLKGLVLSGTFLGIVLVMFFVPTAFPAAVIGAGIVYGLQIAASIIFGGFGLWGAGNFIKQILDPQKPVDPAEKFIHGNALSPSEQKLKTEYLKKNGQYSTLNAHVDDLLIILKLKKATGTKNEKKEFLTKLIEEEEKYLKNKTGERFADKKDALKNLRYLLSHKASYTVRDLMLHYKKNGKIKNIFSAYSQSTSRMQKLFLLIAEYERSVAPLQSNTRSNPTQIINPERVVATQSPEAPPAHQGDSPILESPTSRPQTLRLEEPASPGEITETVAIKAPLKSDTQPPLSMHASKSGLFYHPETNGKSPGAPTPKWSLKQNLNDHTMAAPAA